MKTKEFIFVTSMGANNTYTAINHAPIDYFSMASKICLRQLPQRKVPIFPLCDTVL